jgi:hypothetical protein
MFSGDEPPDLIRGSYTTDLNINKIHEAIEAKFEFYRNNIPLNYTKRYNKLEDLISDTSNL